MAPNSAKMRYRTPVTLKRKKKTTAPTNAPAKPPTMPIQKLPFFSGSPAPAMAGARGRLPIGAMGRGAVMAGGASPPEDGADTGAKPLTRSLGGPAGAGAVVAATGAITGAPV